MNQISMLLEVAEGDEWFDLTIERAELFLDNAGSFMVMLRTLPADYLPLMQEHYMHLKPLTQIARDTGSCYRTITRLHAEALAVMDEYFRKKKEK